eukprot:6070502-Amphidinium_carterae.1
MMSLLGFAATPEGLYAESAHVLIDWPPESAPKFLHELREAMRILVLRQSRAAQFVPAEVTLDKERCKVAATLTRTQSNFIAALQMASHRADTEKQCPLCGVHNLPGQELLHAIWNCEATSIALAASAPTGSAEWPLLFKRFALVTTDMELCPFDVASGQEFMTRVLLERRQLQLPADLDHKKRKRLDRSTLAVPVEAASEDELHPK